MNKPWIPLLLLCGSNISKHCIGVKRDRYQGVSGSQNWLGRSQQKAEPSIAPPEVTQGVSYRVS